MTTDIPSTRIRYCRVDPNANICFASEGYSLTILQVDDPDFGFQVTRNLLIPSEEE